MFQSKMQLGALTPEYFVTPNGEARQLRYNPVNDDCVHVTGVPLSTDRVLWDTVDPSVFAAMDQDHPPCPDDDS